VEILNHDNTYLGEKEIYEKETKPTTQKGREEGE